MKGSSVHLLYLLSYNPVYNKEGRDRTCDPMFQNPKYDPKTTLDYF